ncbi:OLC1v1034083C1 [Oldenlandia corymbosa var. corymbosa]|uniref:OLC1v1034083C1 n=1 Tax=Oldenlandia corymbosa var. corymbosa TaxID=529605 RepID=A0AAV1CQG0_OLDCO|nr:OLC1v1034083C1 [Oldenlandia corymbosa var. corymbosa]
MSQDESRNEPTAAGYAPLGHPRTQPPQYPPPFPGFSNYAYTPGMVGLPIPKGTAYYASAQLPRSPPSPDHEITTGHSQARLTFIFAVIFVIGSLMLGIFTWLILGNRRPQFQVKEFSMPSLNVTNNYTTLEAQWEVKITARNPSRKTEFYLGEIEGSLIYRGLVLDMEVIDPLNLGADSEGVLRATFYVPEPGSGMRSRSATPALARQMEEDRKSGMAEFDLRLIMETTYSSDNTFWSKRNVIRVLCGDIRVNFSSPTAGGTWFGVRKECLTYG